MKLLSPPGIAGIAIVAVAAKQVGEVLACLRTPAGGAITTAPSTPARAVLQLDGEAVDDVLVIARGDGFELHTHGSPAVLDLLDRQFGLVRAAPANAAERLLAEAMSVEQFDLAAEQLGHDFEQCVGHLRRLPPPERRRQLDDARKRSRRALALAKPERVVLVGRQNAGKSSLFNRLLSRERVLTGATPGLTRDPVAEATVLGGYPYELVDTAGEGDRASALDRQAIDSGRALRAGALQVLVVDGGRAFDRTDRSLAEQAVLIVRSKADLPAAAWPSDLPSDLPPTLAVSVVGEQAASIRDRLGERLRAVRGLPVAGPVNGFAALDAQQWQRLNEVDDCQRPSPPA